MCHAYPRTQSAALCPTPSTHAPTCPLCTQPSHEERGPRDTDPPWFVLKRPFNRIKRFNLSQAISYGVPTSVSQLMSSRSDGRVLGQMALEPSRRDLVLLPPLGLRNWVIKSGTSSVDFWGALGSAGPPFLGTLWVRGRKVTPSAPNSRWPSSSPFGGGSPNPPPPPHTLPPALPC